MSGFARSIRLFLMDGDASGRWKCELSNWTGLAFRIPRTMIQKSSDRAELSYTGVYFLIGHDEEQGDSVYIGEAEGIQKRINQHITSDKWQDWTECIVFVSKDDELNKAQVKYMESSLYELAQKAGRCRLQNMNHPTKSSLSEADEAEMMEYLANLRLLLGTMGQRFLEPPITKDEEHEGIVFRMSSTKTGYDARGMVVSDGFVVLKGSRISDGIANSFKDKNYNKLRDYLISNGTIIDGVFTRDYHFNSYSASSSVIQGHNSNGWIEWHTNDGKSLDEEMKSQGSLNDDKMNRDAS